MSREPMPPLAAWRAVARCVATSLAMLARHTTHLPHANLDRWISFADGTTARVYRETTVDRGPAEPCVLVVTFRLRAVRGWGHTLFRAESLLNTPLFIGFPGFTSKLWLAHDEQDRYRGLYEWDGAERADRYARSLWRVLALVSERGSIDYRVITGVRRDHLLAQPDLVESVAAEDARAWWRVVDAR